MYKFVNMMSCFSKGWLRWQSMPVGNLYFSLLWAPLLPPGAAPRVLAPPPEGVPQPLGPLQLSNTEQ